jgi:hypothetical protein
VISQRADRVGDAAPPSALPATLGPHPAIASRGAAKVWLAAGGAPVAQHIAAGAPIDAPIDADADPGANAGVRRGIAVLEVAPFLFDPSERFCRSAAGAAWLTDAIRRAAGERPGQITIPPAATVSILDGASVAVAALVGDAVDRTGDRAGDAGVVAVHPGGALPAPVAMASDAALQTGGGGWRTWEWLVLLGLLLASADLWLHLRGRIP